MTVAVGSTTVVDKCAQPIPCCSFKNPFICVVDFPVPPGEVGTLNGGSLVVTARQKGSITGLSQTCQYNTENVLFVATVTLSTRNYTTFHPTLDPTASPSFTSTATALTVGTKVGIAIASAGAVVGGYFVSTYILKKFKPSSLASAEGLELQKM